VTGRARRLFITTLEDTKKGLIKAFRLRFDAFVAAASCCISDVGRG
jgi:hypothetical protein